MENKKYKKIECIGSTLYNCVNKLLEYKDRGELVYVDFNGHKLYSDTTTMDSAYKQVTGMPYHQYQEYLKKLEKERKEQEREHDEAIPRLIEEWKQKGREILEEDKIEFWDELVPVRLKDLYKGMELGASLDIIKILNNNGTLEEAKKKIIEQNHSGMSFGLVCSMVHALCSRGEEFVNYVK